MTKHSAHVLAYRKHKLRAGLAAAAATLATMKAATH